MSQLNESYYGNDTTPEDAMYHVQMTAIPVLVLGGTVGNLLSMWVLTRSPLRGLSSSLYLSALSGTDTGFLMSLFLVWLSGIGSDFYTSSGWCQCITYTTHVTTFLSVWFVVAFTAERFIAVCYPLLRSAVCTVERARAIVLVLVVVSLILYSYILQVAGSVTVDGTANCMLKEGYHYLGSVMDHVDMVVTFVLPVIIIVSLNLCIIRTVWYIGRLAPTNLCGDQELSNRSMAHQVKITKTLLIISTVFIILNMPSYVVRTYFFFTVSI